MEMIHITKKHLISWLAVFLLGGTIVLVVYNAGESRSIENFIDSITIRNIFEAILLAINSFVLAYFISLVLPEENSKFDTPAMVDKKDKPVVYDKLVRDLIPEHLAQNGVDFRIHIADDTEYEEKLFAKLSEEVLELARDKNIDEAADVLEVLDAVIAYKGFSKQEIEMTRRDKFEKRGGFSRKIILEETLN